MLMISTCTCCSLTGKQGQQSKRSSKLGGHNRIKVRAKLHVVLLVWPTQSDGLIRRRGAPRASERMNTGVRLIGDESLYLWLCSDNKTILAEDVKETNRVTDAGLKI